MPTSEERKEVAARLRERAAMRYRYNHQDPDLLGCFVTNLTKPHCGEPTIGNVLSRLADLIEPEPERTCWNDSLKRGKGVFHCSECGIHLDIADMEEEDMDVFYEPNFCPNCGRKVVEQ